jgi:hypothetical protein
MKYIGGTDIIHYGDSLIERRGLWQRGGGVAHSDGERWSLIVERLRERAEGP